MSADAIATRPRAWRPWRWWLVAILVIGLAVAAYLLKPVVGPPRDLALVGDVTRGNYIIRLSGCISCHTDLDHGGAYLAGGAPIVTVFGKFYPPNITPDPQTGIGGWTLAQFSDAVSDGNGPHGNLYPVFPYNDLTLMSDQEIADLYAAIMATPAVVNTPPANEVVFPLNFRFLISGWKNLFFSPHRYRNDPAHSAQWNRGAYLANGPAHCVACHSPVNILGAVVSGKQLEGNPAGGTSGKTPPLTALALLQDGYTIDTLAQTLRTGVTPNAGKVGAEMAPVIRDDTSHWTDADLTAIATYLLSAR